MAERNIELVGASYIEGRKVEILVRVKDYINDEYVDVSIPRDELSPQTVNKIIVDNNGVCQNAKKICDSLKKSFDDSLLNGKLLVRRFHEHLGWGKVKEKVVFYGLNVISANDEVESSYCGNVDVKHVGDIENISNMIRNQIMPLEEWSPLEAVIAFGVGATVLPYANIAWNASLNNIMVHLLGDSSTGKSTSLMLFSGLGSNPSPKKGYWINYGSSDVSIIKRIGNNNGYPVVIDELSEGSRKECDALVYSIGNGEEKDRLKPGGNGFQQSSTFQTVVLSSGEVSLIKKCSKNGGVRARCVELSNIYWTDSKQQSLAVKECMQKNYGLVTPKVAQELVMNNVKWRERWAYWKSQIENRIEKDEIKLSVSERISDYVAIFALSAEIANVVLSVELDVKKIFGFCYEHIIIANEEEANLSARAYSAIVEYISINKERFADATFYSGCRSMYDDITLTANEDGFFHKTRRKNIDGKDYDMVYVFRRGIIENVLSDAGFSDIKVTLFKLREGGYLKTKDKQRNTYAYTVNGSSQNCVAVYFADETMNGCKIEDE